MPRQEPRIVLRDELHLPKWHHSIGISQKYDDDHRAIPELRTRRDLVWILDVDHNPGGMVRGAEAVCVTDRGAHFYYSKRPVGAVRKHQDPAFWFNALKRGYWSEILFNPDGSYREVQLLRGQRKVFRHGMKPETPVEWHQHYFELAQERWRSHRVEGAKLDAILD